MNFGGTSSSSRDEHSPYSNKYEEEIRGWEEEIREWDGEQASLMHLDSTNNFLIASCIVEDEESMYKGSIPSHIFINHGREVGRVWLWNAYFSTNLSYGKDLFRKCFQMRWDLFLRIIDAVKDHDNFILPKTKITLADMHYLFCKKLQLFFELWHQIQLMNM